MIDLYCPYCGDRHTEKPHPTIDERLGPCAWNWRHCQPCHNGDRNEQDPGCCCRQRESWGYLLQADEVIK